MDAKIQQVICKEIVLEDTDVARAILGFVSDAAIEKLILGAPKGGLVRCFSVLPYACVCVYIYIIYNDPLFSTNSCFSL